MSNIEVSTERSTGSWDVLLRMGRSLRITAIAVIVVLSIGIALVLQGQMMNNPDLAHWLTRPTLLIAGFSSMMFLTVTYLIGKEWSVVRSQRAVLVTALEEESINMARRFNPVVDFHHPEVCREILTQQASLAARLHAPISILELSLSEMGSQPLAPQWRQFGSELSRQVKARSRQTDSMLRWTPESFLLVMPEVSAEEMGVITTRLHNELEVWFQERFDANRRPTLQSRGFTTDILGKSSDILRETQALLEEQARLSSPKADGKRMQVRREKSVGLTLQFDISGMDAGGQEFCDRIITQRVSADCIWFAWNREVELEASLQVSDREGTVSAKAVLAEFATVKGERIAEVRFPKAPDNWVM
ncbi:MAG: hypothetical protein EXQ56_04455 [Acidobacteria bacterium]|nr:hypothetical protein [Acidobacteriota bacterium]